jgi:hypothetical protein
MDDLAQLDDIVIFELPALEDVEAFCDRFRLRWSGWLHADADVCLFTADLGGDDLAQVLRGAQDLVAELGLAAIRFYLDGRVYVLEAAPQGETATLVALRPGLSG